MIFCLHSMLHFSVAVLFSRCYQRAGLLPDKSRLKIFSFYFLLLPSCKAHRTTQFLNLLSSAFTNGPVICVRMTRGTCPNDQAEITVLCIFTSFVHILKKAPFCTGVRKTTGSEVRESDNGRSTCFSARSVLHMLVSMPLCSLAIPNVPTQCIHYTFNTTAGHWNTAKRQLAAEAYFL